MYAIVTAILIATAPQTPPENLAAFFTVDGPALCTAIAEGLNSGKPETLYVCEVGHE
jgi:hypothetical protein